MCSPVDLGVRSQMSVGTTAPLSFPSNSQLNGQLTLKSCHDVYNFTYSRRRSCPWVREYYVRPTHWLFHAKPIFLAFLVRVPIAHTAQYRLYDRLLISSLVHANSETALSSGLCEFLFDKVFDGFYIMVGGTFDLLDVVTVFLGKIGNDRIDLRDCLF